MVSVRSAAARRRRSSSRPEAPATGTRHVLDVKRAAPLVLIVDDSEDTRDLYGELLVRHGFRVTTAVDGEHALWKVLTMMPVVVVMDLAMPGLDGWEATRQIKANEKTRHIHVIALTGHATVAHVQRAHDAGADVVLTKPCQPPTLLAEIDRLLGG